LYATTINCLIESLLFFSDTNLALWTFLAKKISMALFYKLNPNENLYPPLLFKGSEPIEIKKPKAKKAKAKVSKPKTKKKVLKAKKKVAKKVSKKSKR
jgi:hypothetical protein